MANTYHQIYIQSIFVVEDRNCLITEDWRGELYQYISGIVEKRGSKVLQIGGVADHVHLFFGMKPNDSISEIMKWVKGSSSEWINRNAFLEHKFKWQSGFAAFSYSASHVKAVCNYIANQEKHHKKETFQEEYLKFLKAFEVPFDERFLFNPIE